MNKKNYRIVTAAAVIFWAILIFSFSNQPAVTSGKVSGGVCHRIVEGTEQVLRLDMTKQQIAQAAKKIEYPVRKAAHMTEYAILGQLSFAFYAGYFGKRRKSYLAAFFTAAVYAATDEFHQYFIPGRSAEVRDVCIDAAGALLGLIFLYFLLKMVRKHCQKRDVTLQ